MKKHTEQNADQILFFVLGGVGKNIIATVVLQALKKAHPKKEIIVVSPHEMIWENNPDIKECVNPDIAEDFYNTHLKDKNSLIFKHDPYHAPDFIYKRKHLIDIWCELCGVKWKGEKPMVYLTEEERRVAKNRAGGVLPLFLLQTHGGAPNQAHPISWARDMPLPLAEEIVQIMKNKGYRVIHLRRKDQPVVKDAEYIDMSLRESIALLEFSDKRLFIDSVMQHAAAALELPATVLWISNKPETFGYKLHTNITPSIDESFRHYPESYLEKIDITGALHQDPYDTNDIFDKEKIIKTLLG